MGTVITLPRELNSRGIARHTVPELSTESDVVLDAGATVRTTPGALDELVKTLLNGDLQRVIVVNADAALERGLRVVHRARTRPERTFLLTFRQVAAEALLRAV